MSCTKGILTQSLAILGAATLVAGVHWGVQPLWVNPEDGLPAVRPARAVVNEAPPVRVVPTPTDSSESGDSGVGEGLSGEPDPLISAEPGESVVVPPESNFTELPRNITTAQSFLLYQSGQVDFVDARAAEIYEAGHIAGAFSVPYTEAAERVARLYADGFLDPARRVVVYCIGGTCDESNYVVRALLQAGFDMIHIDDDGYPAWLAAGHPTASGPDMTQETP